jgi:hypothetical protein
VRFIEVAFDIGDTAGVVVGGALDKKQHAVRPLALESDLRNIRASLPSAFLIAFSTLSLGMFSALAFRIAVRSLGLVSGSGPPSLAAIVMAREIFGKTRDMLAQRFSFEARRYSNARPIMVP